MNGTIYNINNRIYIVSKTGISVLNLWDQWNQNQELNEKSINILNFNENYHINSKGLYAINPDYINPYVAFFTDSDKISIMDIDKKITIISELEDFIYDYVDEIKFSFNGNFLVLLSNDRKNISIINKSGRTCKSHYSNSEIFDFQVIDNHCLYKTFKIFYITNNNNCLIYSSTKDRYENTIKIQLNQDKFNKVAGIPQKIFIDKNSLKIIKGFRVFSTPYDIEKMTPIFKEEIVCIDYSNQDKLWVRGTFYLILKKYWKAVEMFDKTVKNEAKNIKYLYFLAIGHKYLKNYEESLEAINECNLIKNNAYYERAVFLKIYVLDKLNPFNCDKVEQFCKDILSINPNFMKIHEFMLTIITRKGMIGEASIYYKKLEDQGINTKELRQKIANKTKGSLSMNCSQNENSEFSNNISKVTLNSKFINESTNKNLDFTYQKEKNTSMSISNSQILFVCSSSLLHSRQNARSSKIINSNINSILVDNSFKTYNFEDDDIFK